MKPPASLNPRELRLGLIAAVLIVCWVLISVLVQPLWDRAKDLGVHLDTQAEKLSTLNRLLSQQAAIDAGYQARAGYLEGGDDERARGSFLNELEALSREANIRLNLKPRPIKRDARVSRFEVELDAEGSQEQLVAFLDALFRMPALMSVERMRIASIPTKDNWLRANLVIQRVTVRP